MIAKKICAENFRNLKKVEFAPVENVNVLYGDNAQGKTNIIESIWLFTGSHSFRTSKDGDFIKFGEKYSKVSLDFDSNRGSNNLTAAFSADSKSVAANGIKLSGMPALSGVFCAVVFSPDHLELIKSGPAQRRKFIDCAITEIWPRHRAALAEYKNIIRQRNALLKDIPSHSELLDTLTVWDERAAYTGALIAFARLRYLMRLRPKAAGTYEGIAACSGEKLELSYEASKYYYPEDITDRKTATAQIMDSIKKAFKDTRSGDIEAGLTRIGPHRDDVKISIGGLDSRLYSSQGQQRSAVLALKLAEASVLKETIGESPVLLLDDVMSELDAGRRDYILNNIGGFQVFITCCDPSGLSGLRGGASFEVKNGGIVRRD